jgi:hypothetical protein
MRGGTPLGLRSDASVLLPAVRPIRELPILVAFLVGPLVLPLARISEQTIRGPVTASTIRAATPWADAMFGSGRRLASRRDHIAHLLS